MSRKGHKRGQLHRTIQRHPFLKRCNVVDDYAAQLLYDRKRNPSAPIDRGEAEAIIQAREIGAPEVLIDERKGRKIAQAHNLNVKGVVGLIRDFTLGGIIPKAWPLYEECLRHKFRLGNELIEQALKETGEK